MRDVAIVGVGWFGFKPSISDYSFREMAYLAAKKAYEDAGGIDPRKDVDAFVTCEEDYLAGVSISDEFMPDQLGGVLRPVYTIPGDGLQGIANAYMKIKTGFFDIVVVEAHSKASDVLTMNDIISFAFDPIYIRPLGLHPLSLAGLEANCYLFKNKLSREHLAMVAVKNKRNALTNPIACYGAKLSIEDVLNRPYIAEPLTDCDIAPYVDVSIVFVLAGEDVARRLTDKPVWIEGIEYVTETSFVENISLGEAKSTKLAAKKAYGRAEISNPSKEIDFAEIDDRYSYRELMNIEALALNASPIRAELESGSFERNGRLPVNPSGGLIGIGNALEASGLVKLLEAVLQLRGEATGRQIKGARKAVVQIQREIPSTTSVVAILSNRGVG